MLKHTLALAALAAAAEALVRPNEVGKLPAMGWNSWNAYHCEVNEHKMLQAATNLVSKGFKDAGYIYVNNDDCWSNHNGRDNTTHQLLPNMTKYPDGIDGLAKKVHDMGLKFGIYSSAGTLTCGGYPGSLGYEDVDAETFSSWGVDYLKYDNCYVPKWWTDSCYSCIPDSRFGQDFINGTCTKNSDEFRLCNDKWPTDGVNYTASYTALRYRIMQHALMEQNRTILYSLCEWGTNEPWTWGNATANSWRTTDDIEPWWARVAEILNMNSFLNEWADFYGHNDPDMLEVGNGNLTVAETRSHFALWAIMKAPLIIGTTLDNITQTNIDILQNKYLIAFSQDEVYGRPAQPYKWGVNPDYTFNATNPAEYWSGSYTNGTLVAMLNTLDNNRTMTATFSEIPQLMHDGPYKVTNAWTGEDMGCKTDCVEMMVETHDTAVLMIEDSCGGGKVKSKPKREYWAKDKRWWKA